MPDTASLVPEKLSSARAYGGKQGTARAIDVRRLAEVEARVRLGEDELSAFRAVVTSGPLAYRAEECRGAWLRDDGHTRARLARLRVRVAPRVVAEAVAAVQTTLVASVPAAAKTIERLSAGDFSAFRKPVFQDGAKVAEVADPASADVARRAAVDHLAMLGHGPGVKVTSGGTQAVQVNVNGATEAHVAATASAERTAAKFRWARDAIERLLGYAPADVVADVCREGDEVGFRVRPSRTIVTDREAVPA